jgi:hypothetical protein
MEDLFQYVEYQCACHSSQMTFPIDSSTVVVNGEDYLSVRLGVLFSLAMSWSCGEASGLPDPLGRLPDHRAEVMEGAAQ